MTSLDGRERPATRPKARALSITDEFHDATYAMSKAATRLENLHKDIRFGDKSGDLLKKHKADLFRAQTILRKIIQDLP